jgi:hypothetical protein
VASGLEAVREDAVGRRAAPALRGNGVDLPAVRCAAFGRIRRGAEAEAYGLAGIAVQVDDGLLVRACRSRPGEPNNDNS